MTDDVIISSDAFIALEEVRAGDLTDEHLGRRVFVPGMGTVLRGGRPMFGTSVVGRWWTLDRRDDHGRIVARRDDGHEWPFDPQHKELRSRRILLLSDERSQA